MNNDKKEFSTYDNNNMIKKQSTLKNNCQKTMLQLTIFQ